MSCYRLKSYEQPLPGGYPFTQTEGIYKVFPSQPIIEAQAGSVSQFRKINGLPRSSLKESLIDVDHFQCQRLGNMSQFCTACNPSAPAQTALNQSSPIVAPPCAGCGAPVQQ